ncbi:MAG TPA: flagellin [Candidatus Paceibacterota bacterium]|nr:flagellin [Candidatus Paceibacterota bacterium]
MIISTNVTSQVSAHNLESSQSLLSKSLSRLSSGSKIVNPADDAAGMAVSSRLVAQIRRLDAARGNVGNAISFTQTQDGYLRKIADALTRMSELSLQAQDVTKSDADRALYQSEFTQLSAFISNSATKDFNGVSLFGGASLDVTLDSEGNTLTMNGISLSTAVYTNVLGASVSDVAAAKAALNSVKLAISQLSQDRAGIGAYQSRLNYTSDQLIVSKENVTAANSRIQDVDVAEESTEFAKQNILVQSGTAMLAQANNLPQTVLKLLQ